MAKQRYNGGRKPEYIERFRTELINKNWEFLANEFNEGNESRKFEITKMLMPILAKTVPQVNINENNNKTEITFSDEDREMVRGILDEFKDKLRK